MNKLAKKKSMKNNKITLARLLILFGFFFLFTFGGYFIGGNTDIIVPTFVCEYVGGGATTGVCIAFIDFDKYLSSDTLVFGAGMIGCLVMVLALGRLWCGYACPFGLVQDIVTIIRQKLRISQINIPQKFKPVITLAKWYLVFYLLFEDLCKVCPIQLFTVPLGGYTSNTSDWVFFWGIVTAVFIIISDRAFCRVCPLGAMMGLANKISGSRLKKCGDACTHCGICLEVCPMDIKEIYDDIDHDDITHPECLYCMKCIEACPEKDALKFDLFGKTILRSKRKGE